MSREPSFDVDAFYRRYGPMVLRRCVQLLRDQDKAEDCTQDVFVQLVRYQDRLRAEAPSSLMNRIATNVCLNRLRAERARPAAGRGEEDEDVVAQIACEEDLEGRTVASRLLAFLFRAEGSLTRTMAVYHYVDGMTHQEIADEVGLSAEGVRKHLRKLRLRLGVREQEVAA